MKRVFLVLLLSILALNLVCQVHWTKHPDNPVLTPGSPGEWDEAAVFYSNVIYYDSTYHIWYSGSRKDSTRIGHATSPDGIIWTKDANNPVLDIGLEGAWDDQQAYSGYVLLIDSVFHMWYNGQAGMIYEQNNKIGHATSPDGITWIKDPNNPVLTTGPNGTWDDEWSCYSKVVHTDGTFHMWYTGYDGSTGMRIGHATSPDGVAWTKDPLNPVITSSGEWDAPLVFSGGTIFDGSNYHMWYFGGKAFATDIGYATSEDGSQWEKYSQPVIRKGPAGSWESKLVASSTVLFDSTEYKYKMWYNGNSTSELEGGSIGYAESDTCSDIVCPELTAEDSLYQPNYIEVTSTEDGIIYLTLYANHYSLAAIREASIDSVVAYADTPVQISLVDPQNGYLRLYARDNRNNISNPHRITILGVGTLDSRANSSVSIYPNPAVSMLNIQTSRSGEFSIVIETLNGKEISSGRFNGTTHQIDLSSFQKGVYLITIRSKDFVTTRKIIKL